MGHDFGIVSVESARLMRCKNCIAVNKVQDSARMGCARQYCMCGRQAVYCCPEWLVLKCTLEGLAIVDEMCLVHG